MSGNESQKNKASWLSRRSLVGIGFFILISIYLTSYYSLSRRGIRECCIGYNLDRFTYLPLTELQKDIYTEEKSLNKRHKLLVILFYPINRLDNAMFDTCIARTQLYPRPLSPREDIYPWSNPWFPSKEPK